MAMVDLNGYGQELQRLEAAFNWKLQDSAFNVWWQELSKMESLTDNDFILAVTKAVYGSGRFPTLGEIIKLCNEAAADRREREAAKVKTEENKYRKLSQVQILKQDSISPYAQKLIANLKDFLEGRITRKQWLINQKNLQEKKYGRHEAVIDHNLAKTKLQEEIGVEREF